MRQALRISRMERRVRDVRRATEFYVAALGFEATAETDRVVLRRGKQVLTLATGGGAGAHVACCDQGFQHLALPVTDMDAAAARLMAFGPQLISRGGPQLLPASSGGATALKFYDPDGLPLELIRFADRHEGGIDHSAIVVSDVERSIAFYRDLLGLRVVARQTNSGPEQDRLDGLTGVKVDVVALAPEVTTPHVELLGYRNPIVRLRQPDGEWSTRYVVEMYGQGEPALLQDPDGHALLLEPAKSGE